MNIAEISQLQDKSWVNDPIVGTILHPKNIETKTGKTMSSASLEDSTGKIDIKSMDLDLFPYGGKTVEIVGKGTKKDSYNGYAQVWLGRGSQIVPLDNQQSPLNGHPVKSPPAARKLDDDFVPQTLTYMMGDAAQIWLSMPDSDGNLSPAGIGSIAATMYKARELAVELVRGK